MATTKKTSLHNCSNSVPSALHPFISQCDEHLHRLKLSEATSSSSSSSSIGQKLDGLHALYDYTDEMLQLPTIQQALSQESCKTSVDELLERAPRLLDICRIAKDVMLESTESIHRLQSEVCRNRGSGAAFITEGGKYLSSRKKAKKTNLKALENFKGFKKVSVSTSTNTDDESMSMICNLKEAEVVTLIQLESLLSFIAGSRGKPKWSVVSKFGAA